MMKPLGSRVLLRRPPTTDKVGSIFIPQRAQAPPQEGTVVAIGADVTTVAIGEQVLVGKYNTVPIPGAPDLMLVWAKDIMAVLEPTP